MTPFLFIIPYLRQENIQQTLLRAAGPNVAIGDELLRPAKDATGIGAHELLRADEKS